ncbi:hypothetical protein ACO2RV_24305 [Ancylobacter sp. VNQ12]|uniref:hypothetical protein n=1 Tax=Ancylobacter sp. VNQ12 TaxID=3400920 RepID=UPI003C099B75
MLALDEFTIGSFTDAKPLSLVLPRSAYDFKVLVAGTHEEPAYVCLDERAPFSLFGQNEALACSGLIVPGVKIELDAGKAVAEHDKTAGSLIRQGTTAAILVAGHRHYYGLRPVTVVDGLAHVGQLAPAVFPEWQIVLGQGPEKRVLWCSSEARAQAGN